MCACGSEACRLESDGHGNGECSENGPSSRLNLYWSLREQSFQSINTGIPGSHKDESSLQGLPVISSPRYISVWLHTRSFWFNSNTPMSGSEVQTEKCLYASVVSGLPQQRISITNLIEVAADRLQYFLFQRLESSGIVEEAQNFI